MDLDNIEPIVNRVAKSPLITFDLSELLPESDMVQYDLKQDLFQEMILREKDFRQSLKERDWSEFKDKYVALHCSVDAIVPTWAYMLLITYLQEYAKDIIVGTIEDLQKRIIINEIENLPLENYRNGKVVLKGCSDIKDPDFAFAEVTKKLAPIVKTLMYGEPCSTVPIFKKK